MCVTKSVQSDRKLIFGAGVVLYKNVNIVCDHEILQAGTIGLTNIPETTSRGASGHLQNAIKYCTKVRKTGPASQGVE